MAGNLVWAVLVSISVTTQSSPQTPATSPKQCFEHYILTRSGFVVESSAVLNYFTPEYVYCDGGDHGPVQAISIPTPKLDLPWSQNRYQTVWREWMEICFVL